MGGFSDLDLSFHFCPFCPFCPFWDFPDFSGIFLICSGMFRGFYRFVPFLFLGLLRAPTRNSPERVHDTLWTFPEKSGKPPGLETPWFSFSQKILVRKLVTIRLFRHDFQGFCHYFWDLATIFWKLVNNFRSKARFWNFEASFEKCGAMMAIGALEWY